MFYTIIIYSVSFDSIKSYSIFAMSTDNKCCKYNKKQLNKRYDYERIYILNRKRKIQ